MKLVKEFISTYRTDENFKNIVCSISEVIVFGLLTISFFLLFGYYLLYLGERY